MRIAGAGRSFAYRIIFYVPRLDKRDVEYSKHVHGNEYREKQEDKVWMLRVVHQVEMKRDKIARRAKENIRNIANDVGVQR